MMSEITEIRNKSFADFKKFSTFYVSDRLYGVDVTHVQEVTKALPITRVQLAPPFIHGLINLRGQIATAICLKDLFELDAQNSTTEYMNVVCRIDGILMSLLVDKIGDVIELDGTQFEATPDTVTKQISKYMDGVYKVPGSLLSVLSVKKILSVLND